MRAYQQRPAASETATAVRSGPRPDQGSSVARHGLHPSLKEAPDPWLASSRSSLLGLQQTHGNRSVQRYLALAARENGASHLTPQVEQALRRAQGGGSPLERGARARMEQAFGVDFTDVRVHADAESGSLSRELNARAFTTGQDIFFGRGEYNPSSPAGRRLLAHELTHVVQQSGPVQTGLTVSGPEDASERQADQVATEVLRRGPAASPAAGPPVAPTATLVQRDDGDGEDVVQGVSASDIYDPQGIVATIYFPTNQSSLDDQDRAVLRGVYRSLNIRVMGRRADVSFYGYADYRGAETYNLDLSQQRAETVAGYFSGLEHSINYSAQVIPMGESIGPQTGSTSSELQFYRRVDVVVDPPFRPPEPAPEPAPVPEPEPEPVPEPTQPLCGTITDFFETVLLIDQNIVSDAVSCFCLAAGIADVIPIPGVGSNPYVEGVDCVCNALTLIQEAFNRGIEDGCFLPLVNYSLADVAALTALGGLTFADCASLPLGAALATFIGGLIGGSGGGAAAGPPGAAAGTVGGAAAGVTAGTVIADMIVDLAAMAMQNMITQGTPLPVAQCQACARLAARAGVIASPQTLC